MTIAMTALDLRAAAPELFLAVAGLALLMLGVYYKAPATRQASVETRSAEGVTHLTIAALLGALGLVLSGPSAPVEALAGVYRADGYGMFMKAVALLGSVMALVLGLGYFKRSQLDRFELPVLVLFATLGMMMMISANDLMSVYIGLELQSLALYVLAAIKRDDTKSTEAGLKYFVLGALSSGMLLYGMSLVYGFAGTTQFTGLAKVFAAAHGAPIGVVIGLVFMIAGFSFKVSAVPFHMWTPDVYEGAPTPITAFFASAPKVAAMALTLRVLVGPFAELVHDWRQVISFVAIASMVVGAVGAIAQKNIKRMMAYSSIGHMGFALVGVAAGGPDGAAAVMMYMAVYIVMGMGAFAVILSLRNGDRYFESIDDLAGLSKTRPITAMALTAMMFSMAGIPPLAGFFSKYFIFIAAMKSGLFVLSVIGVVASVIGAFYYLRIIKIMYFDEPQQRFDPMEGGEAMVCAVTTLIVVFLFIQPSFIVSTVTNAAKTLFGG